VEPTFAIAIENKLADIQRAQALVEQFLAAHGGSPGVIQTVSLSLEEIASNVIRYGYDDDDRHLIDVRISIHGGEIAIEVVDTGKPFNPLERPDVDTGAPMEERPIGGLGIHLVKKMMDELEYSRQGNQNVLVMKKRL
jgi:anti-sigma regulatory factor (Ser/Thr protein kinase)